MRTNPIAQITLVGTVHAVRDSRAVGNSTVRAVVVEVAKEKGSDRYDCDLWGNADVPREGETVIVTGTLEIRPWKKDGDQHWSTTPTVRQAQIRPLSGASIGEQLNANVASQEAQRQDGLPF